MRTQPFTPETYKAELARIESIARLYSDEPNVVVAVAGERLKAKQFVAVDEGLLSHHALEPTPLEGIYVVGRFIPWELVDGILAQWLNSGDSKPSESP